MTANLLQGASCLFYTDLDGTLLDHDDYSYQAAVPALELLAAANIPWIFNTSKTFAECRLLAQQLDNPYPFVFENGAGVAVPDHSDLVMPGATVSRDGYAIHALAAGRGEAVALLRSLQGSYQFTHFSQMTSEEIVACTGLTLEEALLAADRLYTEPVLWQDSAEALKKFRKVVSVAGLSCLRGGRFLHIMGDADKGRGMTWLTSCLSQRYRNPLMIALGDSENDVAMLNAADIAVRVRSPRHPPPELAKLGKGQSRQQITTREFGPKGWCQAVTEILVQAGVNG